LFAGDPHVVTPDNVATDDASSDCGVDDLIIALGYYNLKVL